MWRRDRSKPRSPRAAANAPVRRVRGSADYVNAPVDGERLRRRLPRVRWRNVALVLGVVTLIAGALVVLNSPLLEIRSVSVRGTQSVAAESVAQLSGLRGQHLLLSDLSAARERILTQPLIKEVAIERVWPNGVRISVEERTPWAGWEADGKVWAIDAEGVVLEGFAPPAGSVTVKQVSSLPALRAGRRVDVEATELIRRLQATDGPANGPRILGFEWALRSGLTVITQHGRITFGGADGFEFKYSVWEELEFEAQRRGEPLLVADLRFGTRPAVEIGLGLGRAARIIEP